LFALFTSIMFGTHTRLILLNMTTVEKMRVQELKDHESAVLAETYSICAFAEKRHARARWDEEWGRPTTEGNIWWLGSGRKNWESVMGQPIWSWLREFCSLVVPTPQPSPRLFYTKCRSAKQRTVAWIIQLIRGLMTKVGGAGGGNGHRT